MSSFLGQLASHLAEKYRVASQKIRVILPTKRSVFFLKKELEKFGDVELLNHIDAQSVEEFISSVTTIKLADQVTLLFTLYNSYKKFEPQVKFDRFMTWAPVLLEDFDRIDLNNVDSDHLFEYLTEAKALERWEQQMPPGKTLHKKETGLHYFSLFERIRQVYKDFTLQLRELGIGYRGMAYRELASNANELLIENKEHDLLVFAGFNAFTESEHILIQRLVKEGKCEVLWDTDRYYMELNKEVEAGDYLRRYKTNQTFGTAWNWMGEELARGEKNVNIYGVPNAVLQAKLAGQLYQQAELLNPNTKTAIVLADENLLLPVLCSLPEEVTDFNVTMGLSLRHSLLYSLVEEVFELHHQGVERLKIDGSIRFSVRSVQRLLNHTYVRQYISLTNVSTEKDIVETILEDQTGRLFFTPQELQELSKDVVLFKTFFTPWQKENSNQIIEAFSTISTALKERFQNNSKHSETAYFNLFEDLLAQFKATLSKHTEAIGSTTFKTFLMEMLRQTKIPFGGEQTSNLQIVGMLETRALDFDRLIILSLNEGVLPKNRQNDSLIPIDIAVEVGIPVFRQQESIMSYHFYRLLQRCKEIHLLYTNTENAPGGAEKSRFIRQLEFEWPRINPNVTIQNVAVSFPPSLPLSRVDWIVKDDIILAKIKQYLTERAIYPTHLNTLINDPMEFYLRYIARVQVESELEEDLGMDKVGSWLHQTLETLDQQYFLQDKVPSQEQIKAYLRQCFTKEFGQYNTEVGLNRLYYMIGEQQLLAFLEHQINEVHDRKPIAAEKELRASIPLEINGEIIEVQLAGKIDRIELVESTKLLIIDYKTGSVTMPTWSKLTDEERDLEIVRGKDFKVGYARQLWFYELLMYLTMQSSQGLVIGGKTYTLQNASVEAAFYSFRKPTELIESTYKLSAVPEEFLAKSKELLTQILTDLLDKDIPFVRSPDADEKRSGVYEGLVTF